MDPKGIRYIGINDPKLKFYESIKQIEKELNDPTISLESYIVSNTPSAIICKLWGVEKSELQKRNILFQEEDREIYIDEILNT